MPWNPEDWDAWIDTGSIAFGRSAPHLAHVRQILEHLPDRERKTVGDLGRRRAQPLPLLESLFQRVLLVDSDEGARKPVGRVTEAGMARCTLGDLDRLRVRLDVTVAVDAIVGPRSRDVDRTLVLVHGALVEGGVLVATFPASPWSDRPFTMQLGPRASEREPQFHEVELQYRLQRAGFQGVRVRRVHSGIERRERLLCMAVRRAWN